MDIIVLSLGLTYDEPNSSDKFLIQSSCSLLKTETADYYQRFLES